MTSGISNDKDIRDKLSYIKCETCPEHEALMGDITALRESAELLHDAVKALQASVQILNETTIKSSEYYERMAKVDTNQEKILTFKEEIYALMAVFGGFVGVIVSVLILL